MGRETGPRVLLNKDCLFIAVAVVVSVLPNLVTGYIYMMMMISGISLQLCVVYVNGAQLVSVFFF